MNAPIQSLEARYYTDPAIFEHERRGLFRTTWQYAGHVSQLREVGDYFTFSIAGEDLFCIRDNDGAVNIQPVPGFSHHDNCPTPIRTEEFCGFIFANLDPKAKPMEDWFPGVREQLAAFVPDWARLQPARWVRVDEACNWKVSIENYSECYHCQRNHPTFSTGIVKPETYDIQPQGYCLRHTTECQNLEMMSYPVDLDRNDYAGQYSSWFLWPLFSFQVYPGNVLNTYQWRAVDTGRVEVWRGWYTEDGQSSEVIDTLAEQDRETTVEEDIHLVESVQRGLQSAGYRPGPLVVDPKGGVNSEHSIAALQSWMREGCTPTQL